MPPLERVGVEIVAMGAERAARQIDAADLKVNKLADSVEKTVTRLQGKGGTRAVFGVGKSFGQAGRGAQAAGKDISSGLTQGARGADVLNTSLKRSGGVIGTFTERITVARTAVFGFLGPLLPVALGLGAILAVANRGAGLQGIVDGFNDAGVAIEPLRDASRGYISDIELMRNVNLGLAGSQGAVRESFVGALPDLLRISGALARRTGESTQFYFESLVRGIKRTAPLLIDNTGLIVKVGEANARYAEETGKSVDSLTAQERQIALINATLLAGSDALASYGTAQELNSNKIDRARATISNLLDQTAFSIQPLFGLVLDLTNGFLDFADAVVPPVLEAATAVFTVATRLIQRAAGFVSPVLAPVRAAITTVFEYINEFGGDVLRGFAFTAGTFAGALVNTFEEAYGVIFGFAQRVADILIGGSPPPFGPLATIDIGGQRTGEAWIMGFAGISIRPVEDLLGFVNMALGSIGDFNRERVAKRIQEINKVIEPFADYVDILTARFNALAEPAKAALEAIDRQIEGLLGAVTAGDSAAVSLLRTLRLQRAEIQQTLDVRQIGVDQSRIELEVARARNSEELVLLGIQERRLGPAKEEEAAVGGVAAAERAATRAREAREKKPRTKAGAGADAAGDGELEIPEIPTGEFQLLDPSSALDFLDDLGTEFQKGFNTARFGDLRTGSEIFDETGELPEGQEGLFGRISDAFAGEDGGTSLFGDLATTLKERFVSPFTDAVSDVAASFGLSGIGSGLLQTIGTFATRAGSAFSGLDISLPAFLTMPFTTVVSAVKDFFAESSVAGSIRERISGFTGNVGTEFDGLEGSLDTSLVGTFRTKVDEAVAFISGLPARISRALSGASAVALPDFAPPDSTVSQFAQSALGGGEAVASFDASGLTGVATALDAIFGETGVFASVKAGIDRVTGDTGALGLLATKVLPFFLPFPIGVLASIGIHAASHFEPSGTFATIGNNLDDLFGTSGTFQRIGDDIDALFKPTGTFGMIGSQVRSAFADLGNAFGSTDLRTDAEIFDETGILPDAGPLQGLVDTISHFFREDGLLAGAFNLLQTKVLPLIVTVGTAFKKEFETGVFAKALEFVAGLYQENGLIWSLEQSVALYFAEDGLLANAFDHLGALFEENGLLWIAARLIEGLFAENTGVLWVAFNSASAIFREGGVVYELSVFLNDFFGTDGTFNRGIQGISDFLSGDLFGGGDVVVPDFAPPDSTVSEFARSQSKGQTDLLSGLRDFVAGIPAALGGLAGNLLSGFTMPFTTAISGIVGFFREKGDEGEGAAILDTIARWVLGVPSAFLGLASAVTTNFRQPFERAFNFVRDLFGGDSAELVPDFAIPDSTVSEFARSSLDGPTGLLDGIIGFVTSIPSALGGLAGNLLSGLTTPFTTASTAVKNFFAESSVAGSIREGVSGFSANVGTEFDGLEGSLDTSLVSTFRTKVDEAVAFITGLPGRISRALSGASAVALPDFAPPGSTVSEFAQSALGGGEAVASFDASGLGGVATALDAIFGETGTFASVKAGIDRVTGDTGALGLLATKVLPFFLPFPIGVLATIGIHAASHFEPSGTFATIGNNLDNLFGTSGTFQGIGDDIDALFKPTGVFGRIGTQVRSAFADLGNAFGSTDLRTDAEIFDETGILPDAGPLQGLVDTFGYYFRSDGLLLTAFGLLETTVVPALQSTATFFKDQMTTGAIGSALRLGLGLFTPPDGLIPSIEQSAKLFFEGDGLLANAFGHLKVAVEPGGLIYGVGAAVTKAFAPETGLIWKAFDTLAAAYRPGGIFHTILSSFNDFFGVGGRFNTIISGISNFLSGGVPTPDASALPGYEDFYGSLEAAPPVPPNLFEGLSDTLDERLLAPFRTAFMSVRVLFGVDEGGAGLLQTIGAFSVRVGSGFSGLAGSLLASLSTPFTTAVTAVKDFFAESSVAGSIRERVSGFSSGIGTEFSGLETGLETGLVGTFRTKVDEAVAFITGLPGRISRALSGASAVALPDFAPPGSTVSQFAQSALGGGEAVASFDASGLGGVATALDAIFGETGTFASVKAGIDRVTGDTGALGLLATKVLPFFLPFPIGVLATIGIHASNHFGPTGTFETVGSDLDNLFGTSGTFQGIGDDIDALFKPTGVFGRIGTQVRSAFADLGNAFGSTDLRTDAEIFDETGILPDAGPLQGLVDTISHFFREDGLLAGAFNLLQTKVLPLIETVGTAFKKEFETGVFAKAIEFVAGLYQENGLIWSLEQSAALYFAEDGLLANAYEHLGALFEENGLLWIAARLIEGLFAENTGLLWIAFDSAGAIFREGGVVFELGVFLNDFFGTDGTFNRGIQGISDFLYGGLGGSSPVRLELDNLVKVSGDPQFGPLAAVPDIEPDTRDVFSRVLDGMRSFVTSIPKALGDLAGNLLEGITMPFTSAIGGVLSFFRGEGEEGEGQGILDVIVGWVTAIPRAFFGLGQVLLKAVRQPFENAFNFVRGLFGGGEVAVPDASALPGYDDFYGSLQEPGRPAESQSGGLFGAGGVFSSLAERATTFFQEGGPLGVAFGLFQTAVGQGGFLHNIFTTVRDAIDSGDISTIAASVSDGLFAEGGVVDKVRSGVETALAADGPVDMAWRKYKGAFQEGGFVYDAIAFASDQLSTEKPGTVGGLAAGVAGLIGGLAGSLVAGFEQARAAPGEGAEGEDAEVVQASAIEQNIEAIRVVLESFGRDLPTWIPDVKGELSTGIVAPFSAMVSDVKALLISDEASATASLQSTITDSLALLPAWLDGTVGIISRSLAGLSGVLDRSLVLPFRAAFDNLQTLLVGGTELQAVGAGVVELPVQGAFGGLAETLSGSLSGALSFDVDIATAALDGDAANSLKNRLTGFVDDVPTYLADLPAALADNLNTVFSTAILGVGEYIDPQDKDAESGLRLFLQSIVPGIPEWLGDIATPFATHFVTPIATAMNAASRIITDPLGYESQAGGGGTAGVFGFAYSLASFFTNTGGVEGTLQYYLDLGVSFFAAMPDKVGRALGSLGGVIWKSFGLPWINLINLLIDETNSFINNVINALTGGLSGIAQSLGLIGTFSPIGNISTTRPDFLKNPYSEAARGGLFGPGGVIVGERGPELIAPAQSFAVFPRDATIALQQLSSMVVPSLPQPLSSNTHNDNRSTTSVTTDNRIQAQFGSVSDERRAQRNLRLQRARSRSRVRRR